MKPGPLSLASSALTLDPAIVADALVATAENFLASGGVVSLAEWSAMPDEERKALYAAAGAVAAQRAHFLAVAILRAQANPAEALA